MILRAQVRIKQSFFFSEFVDFLLPVAETTRAMRIDGRPSQSVIPAIPVSILMEMLSGKCCCLEICDMNTSIASNDAEKLLGVFF